MAAVNEPEIHIVKVPMSAARPPAEAAVEWIIGSGPRPVNALPEDQVHRRSESEWLIDPAS